MLLERETHIGAAPYQRGVERNGYANGFKSRSFQTAIGPLKLSVPQVRESSSVFSSSSLERGSRSDRALKSAIATMYVEGVSTRRVTKIMEELCGFEVSSGQVSKLNKQLDFEFQKWRSRALPPIEYMSLDATYHKVRIDGIVRDCATLTAYGIGCNDGKRIILGVSCALSEAEVHWREFLNQLKQRGIGIPRLVTSDAHLGLKAALKAAIGKAIASALEWWDESEMYAYEGRVEVDNNPCERAIRPTAVGKKNWLFIGEAHAGNRSTIVCTLMECCRRRGIDPFAYLKDVLTRLPEATNWNIGELTPGAWAAAQGRSIKAVA
jgi:hypothetical protein